MSNPISGNFPAPPPTPTPNPTFVEKIIVPVGSETEIPVLYMNPDGTLNRVGSVTVASGSNGRPAGFHYNLLAGSGDPATGEGTYSDGVFLSVSTTDADGNDLSAYYALLIQSLAASSFIVYFPDTNETFTFVSAGWISGSGYIGITITGGTRTIPLGDCYITPVVAGAFNPDAVTIFSKQALFGAQGLTVIGGHIAWNLDTQQAAEVTMTANAVLDNPTHQRAGASYTVIVRQPSAGGKLLTFGNKYLFPESALPTLSTGNNDVDILTFLSDGTYMHGVLQKKFIAT